MGRREQVSSNLGEKLKQTFNIYEPVDDEDQASKEEGLGYF